MFLNIFILDVINSCILSLVAIFISSPFADRSWETMPEKGYQWCLEIENIYDSSLSCLNKCVFFVWLKNLVILSIYSLLRG